MCGFLFVFLQVHAAASLWLFQVKVVSGKIRVNISGNATVFNAAAAVVLSDSNV